MARLARFRFASGTWDRRRKIFKLERYLGYLPAADESDGVVAGKQEKDISRGQTLISPSEMRGHKQKQSGNTHGANFIEVRICGIRIYIRRLFVCSVCGFFKNVLHLQSRCWTGATR